MRKSALVASLLAALNLLPVTAASAADASPCVAFVLDCSRTMQAEFSNATGTDVVAGLRDTAAESRMDVVKDALKTQLDELASHGDHRVALWLFGHRLAWEQDVQEPELMEQTEYLEQSLGFNVLSELLPGDDVELARPLIKLEPEGLQAVSMKLDVVKAWGEDPVYLALVRALDNFGRQVASSDRRIVVITDGANFQGLSKFKTTKAQVLEALDRRPVAVHIIRVGDDDVSRQAEAELKQIANASKGNYVQALTPDDLIKELAVALGEPISETPAAPPATTSVSTGAAVLAAPARPELPQFQNVQGKVTLYKRTVRGAKLTLSASGDERQVVSDANGDFIFKSVPVGQYTLRCEATVKNLIRDAEKAIRVRPQNDEPLEVPVMLEEGPTYSKANIEPISDDE